MNVNEDILLRVRLQLMLNHPFLASSIARLPLVEVPEGRWCSTAATDGFHIFWNRQFFAELTEAEAAGVLAHEVFHVVLGHIDRKGPRLSEAWNEAADHATNLILLQQGMTLPKPHLADPSFRDLPVEEIYKVLLAKDTRGRPSRGSFVLRPGRPGRSPVRPGTGHRRRNRGERGARAFDVHIDPNDPRAVELTGGARPSPLEMGRLRHELLQDVRAELARSMLQGKLPGELVEAIVSAGRPQTPWQALLARCFKGFRRDDYRIVPPSRRHVWRGVYLPSTGVPGPHLVICALDTSGSISLPLARRFLVELHGLRSTAQCKIYVVQCDARITKVTVHESWETPGDAVGRTEFKGGGGTDFRPVFEWISKDVIPREGVPDLVAYLTDGMGTYPQRTPAYPVAWIIPDSSERNPPFGIRISLPIEVA
jgi:predicted metal-dependent peptidase